jgi:hypothetical protein
VWLAGSGGYGLWANASWDSFKAKWQEWAGQGLRLVDLNVHQAGGDNRYSGAWLAGTDAYYLWANVPWESFRARWQQQSANGLRLIDYEFTEPASADALDFTGSPEEAAAPLPSGVGGLFDGETLTDLTDITAGVEGTPTALDGEGGTGGAETGTFTPAAATTGDGVGGVSAGPTPEPVATTAADGDGGLVTDGNQKTVTLTVAGLGGTANGGDHPTKTTRKPKAAKH